MLAAPAAGGGERATARTRALAEREAREAERLEAERPSALGGEASEAERLEADRRSATLAAREAAKAGGVGFLQYANLVPSFWQRPVRVITIESLINLC